MSHERVRVRVGLALTLGCLLLFTLVFSLDEARRWIDGRATVQVRLPAAHGLMHSDPVHFHGVPCGRVVKLDLRQQSRLHGGGNTAFADGGDGEDVSVLLTLEVPPEVRGFLREGSVATIEKTLTGSTVVNLEQGDGGPLPEGMILEGVPVTTMADVTGALQEAIRSVTQVTRSLGPVLEDLQRAGAVSDTLRRFGQAADEIRDLAERADDALDDLSSPIRSLASRGERLLEELDRSVQELPRAIEATRVTAREGRDMVGELRDLVRQVAPDLRASFEDVSATSRNARDLSEELRRRPWRLLRAPNSSDAAAIDLYETAARYAAGATEVRRSLEMVRTALARRGADARANEVLEEALRSLETDLDHQRRIEELFWERMNDGR